MKRLRQLLVVCLIFSMGCANTNYEIHKNEGKKKYGMPEGMYNMLPTKTKQDIRHDYVQMTVKEEIDIEEAEQQIYQKHVTPEIEEKHKSSFVKNYYGMLGFLTVISALSGYFTYR